MPDPVVSTADSELLSHVERVLSNQYEVDREIGRVLEQVREVGADGASGVARTRLAPGETLQELRLGADAPLQVRLRLEARNQFAGVHESDATRMQ